MWHAVPWKGICGMFCTSHMKGKLVHREGGSWVPWRNVHPQNNQVTLRTKHSSPMDHHLAPPISSLWLLGAARAVDSALLLHGPMRIDRNAKSEKKVNGWMERRWTQCQGTGILPTGGWSILPWAQEAMYNFKLYMISTFYSLVFLPFNIQSRESSIHPDTLLIQHWGLCYVMRYEELGTDHNIMTR